jgi:hypothetical protein
MWTVLKHDYFQLLGGLLQYDMTMYVLNVTLKALAVGWDSGQLSTSRPDSNDGPPNVPKMTEDSAFIGEGQL